METATATKTRINGRLATTDQDTAAQAARTWLTRQLGWERRLAELRAKAAR